MTVSSQLAVSQLCLALKLSPITSSSSSVFTWKLPFWRLPVKSGPQITCFNEDFDVSRPNQSRARVLLYPPISLRMHQFKRSVPERFAGCEILRGEGSEASASVDRPDKFYYINLVGGFKHLLFSITEGSLEVKLPRIWTDEKQSRAEAERRERLEERRVEEKESEERRCRCAKR